MNALWAKLRAFLFGREKQETGDDDDVELFTPIVRQGLIVIVLFFGVSSALLIFTRPIALRYFTPRQIRTNYEDAVGKTVKITVRVHNINGTGTAVLNGQEWTARSKDDRIALEEGTLAEVVAVEGVKLILVPTKRVALQKQE